MTSNDEKYHSPVISTPSHRTKIRKEDSKGLVINLTKDNNSITSERSSQDDRFNILQINVDNNSNNMIVKQKIDYVSNNTDLEYIKIIDFSRSSEFNRERTFSQDKDCTTSTTTLSSTLISRSNPTQKKAKEN